MSKQKEKKQAKIKKERKKQELMKQIQEEINKIKDTGVSKEKDNTPNWLQMVINPSIRKHNSVKEKKCFDLPTKVVFRVDTCDSDTYIGQKLK